MPLIRKQPETAKSPSAGKADAFAQMKTGSADERWTAARTLADLPGGVAALGEALGRENDPRVREAMFTALARAATPESAAIVTPYIGSDDAQIRTAAIDALKAMPLAAAGSLPQLLADPDPDVRLLSCEIARATPSSEAARQLCDLLERETQANVCGAAVEVLAEIGDERAAAALSSCAARFPDDPFLMFAVRAAADQLGVQLSPSP